jgi:hypothetical protein
MKKDIFLILICVFILSGCSNRQLNVKQNLVNLNNDIKIDLSECEKNKKESCMVWQEIEKCSQSDVIINGYSCHCESKESCPPCPVTRGIVCEKCFTGWICNKISN